MAKSGFYFSLESAFSLLLLLVFISSLSWDFPTGFSDLHVMQKQHDLLTVWNYLQETNPSVLENDFKIMFKGSGEIELLENSLPIHKLKINESRCKKNLFCSKTSIYKKEGKIGKFYEIKLCTCS